MASNTASPYGTLHAPQKEKSRGNSAFLTATLIVADVVGAGVLAMGDAVAKLGWCLGAILILLMLAVNTHTAILLWRVHQVYPKTTSYSDLAVASFGTANQPQKDAIQVLVAGAQYGSIFLSLGLYSLSIGQGLGMLFYEVHLCLPVFTLAGCLLLLPLNFSVRNLHSFRWAPHINVACTLGTVLTPILWMTVHGLEVTRMETSRVVPFETLSAFNVFSAVSTVAFALQGHPIIVEILAEMTDTSEFPKAYIGLSAPFQACTFLGVGLSVYYFRGSASSEMLLTEIPFGGYNQIAALCMLTHMVITYVINSVVLGSKVDKWIRPSVGHLAWPIAVLSIVFGSYLTAQIIPFFDDLVDVLGTTLTPLLCLVIPITLLLRCVFDDRIALGKFEASVLMLELFFATVLIIQGTVSTLQHIVAQWHTYGWPFACHCEDIWNTCQCSANRMADCLTS